MNPVTYKKYKTLQSFLKRNLRSLQKSYPDIVGAHVYYKTRNGKQMPRYAIVFHVKRKNKKKNAPKNIPPYFTITTGKNKKSRVPTDVIESGTAKLHMRAGSWVYSKGFPDYAGSCGPIFPLTDTGATSYYLVTSMHVIGHSYLLNDETDPDVDKGAASVEVLNSQNVAIADFLRGTLDETMDAAVAQIRPGETINLILPGIGSPNGVIDLTQADIPSSGYPVTMINTTNKNKISLLRVCNAHRSFKTVVPSHHGELMMRDLLALKKISSKGDSGSIIINDNSEIVGIIVGSDETFTYAIPIKRIISKFKLKL